MNYNLKIQNPFDQKLDSYKLRNSFMKYLNKPNTLIGFVRESLGVIFTTTQGYLEYRFCTIFSSESKQAFHFINYL